MFGSIQTFFSRDFMAERGGWVRGKIFPWRYFSRGKEFSMEGEPDFPALFKKTIIN